MISRSFQCRGFLGSAGLSVLTLIIPAIFPPAVSQVTSVHYKGVISGLAGETLEIPGEPGNWVGLIVEAAMYRDSALTDPVSARVFRSTVEYLGKGESRRANVSFGLDTAGTFYLQTTKRGTVSGISYRYRFLYRVQSFWPRIPEPPEERYVYGDMRPVFFFAGYKDLTKYSYEIVSDQRIIDKGQGYMFPARRLWDSLGLVDRTVTLRGLYEGRPFPYSTSDPGGGERVGRSEWSISVVRPQRFLVMSLWREAGREPPKLDFGGRRDSLDFLDPRRFLFAWYSEVGDVVLHRASKNPSISITSSPAGFLRDIQQYANATYWNVAELEVNPTALRGTSSDRPRLVTLTVRFTDEFGSFERTYTARVFASQ